MIVSFDVFDTLLTRDVADPQMIFVRVALQCKTDAQCPPIDPEVFAAERYRAERTWRRQGAYPTLETIYQTLGQNLHLTGEFCSHLMSTELALEEQSLHLVPPNVRLLNQYRESGHSIIFISDTYFPSAFIIRILRENHIFCPKDKLFASCEHSAGKKTGLLFTKVAQTLETTCDQILHHGDSHQADVAGARKSGVKAEPLTITHANKYERIIGTFHEKFPIDTAVKLYISQIAALCRDLRLTSRSPHRSLRNVSTTVAGPILFSFCNWVISSAVKDKVDRLYFLARDGHILLKIAKTLSATKPNGLDLRYLHISRASLLLASFRPTPEETHLNRLVQACGHMSLRDFFCLLTDDSAELLTHYHARLHSTTLREISVDQVLQALRSRPDIYARVYQESQRKRHLLTSYLRQEGVLAESGRVALVDVGWKLTIHDLLAEVVVSADGKAPLGYYYGIADVPTNPRHGQRRAYMWDERVRANWVASEMITRMIEMFCATDQNRTIGYTQTDSGIKPRFSGSDDSLYRDWGIGEIHRGILDFCENANIVDRPQSWEQWDRLLTRQLAEVFWHYPAQEDIDEWGTFPFLVQDGQTKTFTPIFVKSGTLKTATYLWRHASWRGCDQNSWVAANKKSLRPVVKTLLKALLEIRNRLYT